VRFVRPAFSLEIGLANGVSALYIAQALRDNGAGRHLAIDPYQSTDWEDAGLVTLERVGLGTLVSLDPRPSHWVLPELEREGRRIQFAFVDGNHLFDYVMSDFSGIDRILEIGGLIAFDDADWPAIGKVIRFALANRPYEVFDTGTVIEPAKVRPRLASHAVRTMARWIPILRRVLRHDWVVPAHAVGIRGRLVVLRKTADDQRDGQSRHFAEF
jgi:predicted O-methyltransferase YrrM